MKKLKHFLAKRRAKNQDPGGNSNETTDTTKNS
jgi:hypothetical protein